MDHKYRTLDINNDTVEAVRALKLTGVTTDDNLNFNLHINKLYVSQEISTV